MEVHPKSWLWEGFSVKLDGITNVYGSTKLFNCNRKAEEVLVAATDSNEKALENCFRIVRFDRADNLRGTAPTVELPGLTEFQSSFTVLAVHSIPKKDVNLICVIFINQVEEDPENESLDQKCCINIYSAPSVDDAASTPVDYVEQVVTFNPTNVTDAFLGTPEDDQNVFLIPCENSDVHIFRNCSTDQLFKFSELSHDESQKLFPEFQFDRRFLEQVDQPLPLIMWLDVMYVPFAEHKRLSAIAWENGNIQLALTSITTSQENTTESPPIAVELLFAKVICFDGPVTQLRFFTSKAVDLGNTEINLVVCTALEFVYVYHDVVNSSFSKVVPFDDSSIEADCVLCCAVYDIDMDCQNEIVIGTFYQQIAAFKFSPVKNIYELMWERKYPGPVRALEVVDLSNDGVHDLIVVTNNSVHIMQHNIAYIAQICKQNLLAFVKRLETGGETTPPPVGGLNKGEDDSLNATAYLHKEASN